MGRTLRSFAFKDAKNRRDDSQKSFKANATAEREFYRQLKKVAHASGHIVDQYADGASLTDVIAMQATLKKYAKDLGPWATRQSAKLLAKIDKKSAKAYKKHYDTTAEKIGAALRTNVAEQDVGGVAGRLLLEQVALIQSIPLEAGERAQNIAYENFLQGRRAVPDQSVIDDLVKQMGMSTEVATSRAKLIARTETARANASFVQARANALGVTKYIWRTTLDGAERTAHKEMNGKEVEYSTPPRLSDGTVGHAGTFPNCRCYQDPVIPGSNPPEYPRPRR